MSCWQPVRAGAAIVNDDGAITVIPLRAPPMKETPDKLLVIVMIVIIAGLMYVTDDTIKNSNRC